ncbi:MAG: hypothetical protein ABIY51_15400 [Ferruginibacter sp.]
MILKKQFSISRLPKIIPAALLLAFFISGCSVQLVPAHSAEIEQQITEGAKMSDRLYMEMMSAAPDKKNYSLYADKYLSVAVEINSILFKNETRPKATDIVASVQKLKDFFTKAMEDHRSRNTLSNGEFLIYNEQLKAFWKPVLIEEMALKKAK